MTFRKYSSSAEVLFIARLALAGIVTRSEGLGFGTELPGWNVIRRSQFAAIAEATGAGAWFMALVRLTDRVVSAGQGEQRVGSRGC